MSTYEEEVSAMFDDLKRKTDAYWALVDARRAAEAAFRDSRPPTPDRADNNYSVKLESE